jgi:murein DD-endopeptidase MepM/ murein hydrolase activator NlpD
MGCSCGGVAPSNNGFVPFDPLTIVGGGHVPLTAAQLEECNLAQTQDAPPEGDQLNKNKIENVSILFNCDGTINEQLRLTPGSDPVAKWGWSPSADFDFDPSTGKLSGSTDVSSPKVFNITFTAYRADGSVIDSRPYKIVAENCDGGVKFIHPLPGSVCTSKCSANRVHPVTGQTRAHKGCDFAYPGGKTDKVLAAADGKVIFAGTMSGYGNIVSIEHYVNGKPACYSKYAHLAQIYVSVGQKVSAGTPIGMEGNTGISSGAHLHFEVRTGSGTSADAQVIDPLSVINGEFKVSNTGSPEPTPGDPGSVETRKNENKQIGKTKASQGCEQVGPEPEPTFTEKEPPMADEDCFEKCFNHTMKEEVGPAYNPKDPSCIDGSDPKKCGLVNHPKDPGGLTKFGVSKRANPDVDIAKLDLAGARAIYKKRYWEPCKADQLNTCKKKLLMVDAMYLGGLGMVNYICNEVTGSGIGGAISKINSMSDEEFASKYKAARDAYLSSKKNYATFGRGWDRRTKELVSATV